MSALATVYEVGNTNYMFAAKGKYEEVIDSVRSCNVDLLTYELIKLEVKVRKNVFNDFRGRVKATGITIHDVKYTGIDKMKFELRGFTSGVSSHINESVESAKECLDDFIIRFLNTITQNKMKILSFEPTYLVDSRVSHETNNKDGINGNKGKVHSDEWNKAIGEGHRGQKYKTKALEGITWKYEDNKKVWMAAA